MPMAVEASNIAVRFGGVAALTDVSVRIEPGRIVTVIGPNGSGKSTLFNSITGMVALAGGTVRLDGRDLAGVPTHRRIAAGLARTFQTPRFDPRVSVEEAVLCGFYPQSRGTLLGTLMRIPAVSREEGLFRERGEKILADFKLSALKNMALGELPMGQVRLVEVARAVANDPKYLLLDEPAAGLTKVEQALLSAEIRRIAESGVGVLLVEHNFGLVRALSDHTVVLDRGTLLIEGKPETLLHDAAFVDAYLGTTRANHKEAQS
jgi:ABC-type branched-subunit amino acid transport system ATPase component